MRDKTLTAHRTDTRRALAAWLAALALTVPLAAAPAVSHASTDDDTPAIAATLDRSSWG